MNRLERVRQILSENLSPEHLDVIDESHQHARGSAFSHLKVVVVSSKFEGLTKVARQQKVYALLDSEFKAGLHALPLRTLTPSEWEQEGKVDSTSSPVCAGKDSQAFKK